MSADHNDGLVYLGTFGPANCGMSFLIRLISQRIRVISAWVGMASRAQFQPPPTWPETSSSTAALRANHEAHTI